MDATRVSKKSAERVRWSSLRASTLVLVVLALAVGGIGTSSARANPETLIAFDGEAMEYPEGVAVDAEGNVYASLTPLGRLVRIDNGRHDAEQVGSVELAEGDLGLSGLAVDPEGTVYGAVVSTNPAFAGVWRFDAESSEAVRVDGTERMGFANGIAFDDAGVMYATDSAGGAIWAAAPGQPAEVWLDGPMLQGDQSIGLPFPLGANGIAVANGNVYVTVTEQGSVLSIPISDDGSSGEPELVAEFAAEAGPKAIDGIAADSQGNLFVTFVVAHEVWRIGTDGSTELIASAADGLDAPASIAIGRNAAGVETVYITNFSAFMEPFLTSTGIGPGILMFELPL